VQSNGRSRAIQRSHPCDPKGIRERDKRTRKSESRARSPNSDSRRKKKRSPSTAGERQRVPESGGGGRGAAPQPAVALDDAFAAFWAAYPRREARQKAERAFAAAVEAGADPETIIAGARRYAAKRAGEISAGDAPKWTKQAPRWLNEGRWTDEPDHAAGAPVTLDEAGNVVEDEPPKRDPVIEEAFSMLAPSVRSGR
jgi:hypothetical protein